MLELLGVDYLIDVCIEAVNAQRKEEMFWDYQSDCLYIIASYLGCKPSKRFYDILHPQPVDTRTGMEIAKDRLAKFGIEVIS